MKAPIVAYTKGCYSSCVEQFTAIMEYTGWSKNTLYAVFFVGLFLLLLLIVFLLYRFRGKRYRRNTRIK